MTACQQTTSKPLQRLGGNPLSTLNEGHIEVFSKFFRENPQFFLQIDVFRQWLAKERYSHATASNAMQTIGDDPEDAVHNCISHNMQSLSESVSLERPVMPIRALTAIEKIWRNPHELKVLSVGPRSEMELFLLRTHGFKWENIFGLDLLGYSDKVDIGDMHAMPYADHSFDVFLYGWVLGYSKSPETMVNELLRCAKPGAIVAITNDYSTPETVGSHFANEQTHIQKSQQILDLFGDRVKSVYFRQDPDLKTMWASVAVFELK